MRLESPKLCPCARQTRRPTNRNNFTSLLSTTMSLGHLLGGREVTSMILQVVRVRDPQPVELCGRLAATLRETLSQAAQVRRCRLLGCQTLCSCELRLRMCGQCVFVWCCRWHSSSPRKCFLSE